jgi:hypothetical protein
MESSMKDVLSVVTFVMGALCLVMLLTTLKPDGGGAVSAPSMTNPSTTKITDEVNR